jgi:hypothetical protein
MKFTKWPSSVMIWMPRAFGPKSSIFLSRWLTVSDTSSQVPTSLSLMLSALAGKVVVARAAASRITFPFMFDLLRLASICSTFATMETGGGGGHVIALQMG